MNPDPRKCVCKVAAAGESCGAHDHQAVTYYDDREDAA